MLGLSQGLEAQNNTIRVAHLNVGQLSLGRTSHTSIKVREKKDKKKAFKKLIKRLMRISSGYANIHLFFTESR